jgi:hypothetical protein
MYSLKNISERNKIDMVLNQELMHIIGERGYLVRVIII